MSVDSTGKLIKMLRKERGLSQEELGEILGVKKSCVQKYENGSIQNLKMDVLRRICNYFGVPPLVVLFPENAKYFRRDADILDAETVQACLRLNDEARQKVKDYILDLSAIEKYRFIEPLESEQNEAGPETMKKQNAATNQVI